MVILTVSFNEKKLEFNLIFILQNIFDFFNLVHLKFFSFLWNLIKFFIQFY